MSAVEQYLAEHYWTEDDLQRQVRADTAERGPSIEVSAEAGRLLALLVRATGARRVLEVGTLFGYYTRMALERLRPGGLMLADNAIRGGRIVETGAGAGVDGIRAMHDMLASASTGVIATTLPVGDGMAIAVKTAGGT